MTGLTFAISIKFGQDISEEGIALTILDSFQPLASQVDLHFKLLRAMIALIGLLALVVEISNIYKKGKTAIAFALIGFLTLLAIVLEWQDPSTFLILLSITSFLLHAQIENWLK